jgi:hypothetical protein
LSFYTQDLARTYSIAYNATILPELGLDTVLDSEYNSGVDNDEKVTND